jgi:hypothetical protein
MALERPCRRLHMEFACAESLGCGGRPASKCGLSALDAHHAHYENVKILNLIRLALKWRPSRRASRSHNGAAKAAGRRACIPSIDLHCTASPQFNSDKPFLQGVNMTALIMVVDVVVVVVVVAVVF